MAGDALWLSEGFSLLQNYIPTFTFADFLQASW